MIDKGAETSYNLPFDGIQVSFSSRLTAGKRKPFNRKEEEDERKK